MNREKKFKKENSASSGPLRNAPLIKLEIQDYETLGFTIQSILKVCQSALFSKEVNAQYHNEVDIYNLLDLASTLVPMDELKLLDEAIKIRRDVGI